MATAVSICSNALLRLGADPINSFDEADPLGSNNDRARLCLNLWPTVRRLVLRSSVWNCALKRVLLSPDLTPPAFGFSYMFLRPSDWLRTVVIGERDREGIEYRTEGAYFLANIEALPLLYVFDDDNPANYDASLVAGMEMAMTAALAYPVTKSTTLAETLSDMAANSLGLARALDSQDDPAETLGDSALFRARLGGYRGVL